MKFRGCRRDDGRVCCRDRLGTWRLFLGTTAATGPCSSAAGAVPSPGAMRIVEGLLMAPRVRVTMYRKFTFSLFRYDFTQFDVAVLIALLTKMHILVNSEKAHTTSYAAGSA